MRSSLLMLAALAGSSLAYPAELTYDRRTFGLIADILGDVTVDVGSILHLILGGGASASVSVLSGLGAHGAAALEGGALGCSAGKIHHSARAELKAWLHTQSEITGSLKAHLLTWCDASADVTLAADVLASLSAFIPHCAEIAAKESIYVTLEGIFSAVDLESTLVLSLSAQSTLSAFLEAHLGLDADVKAGLGVCANGGVVASLHADIKSSLLAWLNHGDCPLSADLKLSILAWIHGKGGADLVSIGHIGVDALSAISVGASVGVAVEEGGALSKHAQASIAAFLEADIAANLDANVILALKGCAKGHLASALSVEVRTALAVWLSGSDCSLGVELKSVVLLWLSLAVTDTSVDLVTGLVGDITGFLTETVLATLSVNLRGALGVLLSGQSLECLSWEARAELAAFLGGCTSIDIGINIELIIIQWFTGCSIPGAPKPSSSVPSLPSSTGMVSTPVVPSGSASTPSVPSGSITVSIPSGPTGGSTPSGPNGGSGSTPTGASPHETPAPSGPSGAETTPCDTETSAIVSSSIIPGGPNGGSGSTPTGASPHETPAPSGPSGAETTPCDTETSAIVSSSVIPGGPAPTGPAPSGPNGGSGSTPTGASPHETPAPSGPSGAETTPCDTETSAAALALPPLALLPTRLPLPVALTAPKLTPCDTETSAVVSSTVIPGGPAPTGPAPSGPNGGGSGSTPTGASPHETPAPSGPNGAETTPCETETSAVVSSTVIPGGPAPSRHFPL
ncbi:hypothetical protein N7450_009726 [Penicillium hetheringtonii]|uniref:Cell wall protein n=1 Tax=Penicillium hetheringtonii TaxID=911720 RepID=A0AAD6DBH3_9EURO|nr:hypothetical protein N7450_009726 [Penicillium hetheringtonii]